MSEESILRAIIEGYRITISDRYDYADLSKKIELPESIGVDDVNQIKAYFLDYIYPEFDKRKELNSAFESLDSYIKNPEKLLSLLKTSVQLIFRHGRHLPKILSTGLKALKSFRSGTKFEHLLVHQAIQNQIDPPYDSVKINTLISTLPKNEIDQFIIHSQSLIEVFYDQKLVSKIEEILSFLISKMKNNPKLYSENDIRGLALGHEMLSKGNDLFTSFSKKDQRYIISMIIQLEKNVLTEIFNKTT